jgi:hypothetical protein
MKWLKLIMRTILMMWTKLMNWLSSHGDRRRVAAGTAALVLPLTFLMVLFLVSPGTVAGPSAQMPIAQADRDRRERLEAMQSELRTMEARNRIFNDASDSALKAIASTQREIARLNATYGNDIPALRRGYQEQVEMLQTEIHKLDDASRLANTDRQQALQKRDELQTRLDLQSEVYEAQLAQRQREFRETENRLRDAFESQREEQQAIVDQERGRAAASEARSTQILERARQLTQEIRPFLVRDNTLAWSEIPRSLRGRVGILAIRAPAAPAPTPYVLVTETAINEPTRSDLDLLRTRAQEEIAKPGIQSDGFKLGGLPPSSGTSVWLQQLRAASDLTRVSAFGLELEVIPLGRVEPPPHRPSLEALPAGATRLLIVPRSTAAR